jgi:predicted dithiol-disulfide oxidoreductase (DUF899 family)
MRFPNETADYREARARLLQREIELRRSMESVARERRLLPDGGLIPEDYLFEAFDERGHPVKVRFTDLFLPGRDTLAIYSYMFGPDSAEPSRMCTPLLDALNGVAEHVQQRVALVAVAESPAGRLAAFAKERGWWRLRLVSAAGNSYNRDYHGKLENGSDTTILNVFRRKNGETRHFWASELCAGPCDNGQDARGLDLINPIYNMFDLTPDGRGDFRTKSNYGAVR